MGSVTIRYWAAAREAAGRETDDVQASTLAEALRAARSLHGTSSRLSTVLGHSSFLVDGAPVGRRDPDLAELPEGSCVEVLPPFAGG